MLRSTLCTISAPATYPLRGSITHPTQPLCTLRGRRRRRLTQHSLPGCLLGITWVGLLPTDRASFAWRLRRVGPQPDLCGPAPTESVTAAPPKSSESGHNLTSALYLFLRRPLRDFARVFDEHPLDRAERAVNP